MSNDPPPHPAFEGLSDENHHAEHDVQTGTVCPEQMEENTRIQGTGQSDQRGEVQKWNL